MFQSLAFQVREYRFTYIQYIDFVHEKRHMDVRDGGGGVGACDVFRLKIVENFNKLIKVV